MSVYAYLHTTPLFILTTHASQSITTEQLSLWLYSGPADIHRGSLDGSILSWYRRILILSIMHFAVDIG